MIARDASSSVTDSSLCLREVSPSGRPSPPKALLRNSVPLSQCNRTVVTPTSTSFNSIRNESQKPCSACLEAA